MPLMWISAEDTAGLSQEEQCLVNDTAKSIREILRAALWSWKFWPLFKVKKSSFWRQLSRPQLLRCWLIKACCSQDYWKEPYSKHSRALPKGEEGDVKLSPMCRKEKAQSLNFKNVTFGKYFLLHNRLLSRSNVCGCFWWNMEQFYHKITNALQIDFVSVSFKFFSNKLTIVFYQDWF